ncbi:Hek2p NDAI_0A05400 [Naumovozyma dairenensis CBS 421]|uniref:K Homology domain-containing protein n=1 Tax=Naumovozyma dairenensis (strain ATCC 10597 / BCRC 20456 / CBS 421 / NBRC 0211 / NRRL Y-12639) TaxID=1071378 RepID=G0W4F7_NAUDC|nr:hypothetical protein NDAI_0A05400 [Naumovozyma dairenensis CBS 421]CCD22695.1 hypothetical protein NDAI_0A05400 [Naumovozyma dairenensis CBS 421]
MSSSPSQEQQPETGNLPVPTINLRILLSLKEAAKIIGLKGSTISKIRENNTVKIGISDKVPGCSDRILSCAGPINNVSNAIGDCIEILNEIDFDTNGNVLPSLKLEKYSFHFLNNILPPPSSAELKPPSHGNDEQQQEGEEEEEVAEEEIDLNKIGTVRLIISNHHLSSIIGKGGNKIKSLISKHGVKIVASKDFLPDSQERLLEIQGFPGSITNVLIDVCEILLNDIDVNFIPEKRYYPHLSYSNSHHNSHNNNNNNNTDNNNPQNNGNKRQRDHADDYNSNNEFKRNVKIPEIYVGAIVGKQGNRIANLRKFTKTKIMIQKRDGQDDHHSDNDEEENRIFTITSNLEKNVELAESMLLRNLDAEILRRQTKFNNETITRNDNDIEMD